MAKAILLDQEKHQKFDAMARVFTKAARVITGDPDIRCVIAWNQSHVPAPSWTDGKTVWFNADMIGAVQSFDDIVRLTGLFYHELSHILYTLRRGPMVNIIRAKGMGDAYNMLEDQRIETLLTAKYPASIAYLVSTFMRFCLMTPASWDCNFPLMHGRYYLPKDVRAEFKARFTRQDLIPAFVSIIDEYRKLILPLDADRALQLVTEYHELLAAMNASGLTPEDPNGHIEGRPEEVRQGQEPDQDAQQEASDLADAFEDASDAADDDADDASDAGHGSKRDDDAEAEAHDGGSDSDSLDEDVDADSDESGNGSGSGDGDSDEDADGTGSGDADTDATDLQPADAQGAGAGKPTMTNDELAQTLEDYAKEYESLDEVIQEVTQNQRVIVRGDGDISTTLDSGRYVERRVLADDVQASRAFAKVLDTLRADSDPGWKTHQASGRINLRRAVQGAPLSDLWDSWDEGQNDASDIECVVVIDISSSMEPEIEAASRAMWVVKRAMEAVDASVTVLAFDYSAEVVYDRHEKAGHGTYRAMNASGGTKAREAVIEAVRILTSTKRANRIFIAITDGDWMHEANDSRSNLTADQMIAALGNQGVTTGLAHIYTPQGGRSVQSHACQVVTSVNNSADLAVFAKKIVAKAMTNKKGR